MIGQLYLDLIVVSPSFDLLADLYYIDRIPAGPAQTAADMLGVAAALVLWSAARIHRLASPSLTSRHSLGSIGASRDALAQSEMQPDVVLAARLLAWIRPNRNEGADQRRFQTVLLDILAAGLTTASQLGAVIHLL